VSAFEVFGACGIDRKSGCAVIMRPDHDAAHVIPVDARAELAAFFDGFMLRRD
jgi:hypothetical protein